MPADDALGLSCADGLECLLVGGAGFVGGGAGVVVDVFGPGPSAGVADGCAVFALACYCCLEAGCVEGLAEVHGDVHGFMLRDSLVCYCAPKYVRGFEQVFVMVAAWVSLICGCRG